MINFSSVKFNEFTELIRFLKFSDEESEGFNILKRLGRFIPDLTGMQSVILGNIIENVLKDDLTDAEVAFNGFHQTYPDTQFDPEGKLDISKVEYFEVKLQSCEVLFERAVSVLNRDGETSKEEYSINKQIYDAKTLEPLLAIKEPQEYVLHRALYYKQNPNRPITINEFKDADKKTKELLGDKNNVMGKFLHYIFKKKPEDCHFFIEHFLARLDVLYKDKNLEHPLNKEFKEILMKIA